MSKRPMKSPNNYTVMAISAGPQPINAGRNTGRNPGGAQPINQKAARNTRRKEKQRVLVNSLAQRIAEKAVDSTESGYIFMVRQGDDMVYRPVRIDVNGDLTVETIPTQIFREITDDMREFWARAVIDDIFYWDTYLPCPSTLKLVRFECSLKEVTREIFYDRSDAIEQRKVAAMTKLTAKEAKLLGLEKEYATMLMLQNKSDLRDARRLSVKLRSEAEAFATFS